MKNWTSNLKCLKVWGYLAKVNISTNRKRKLGTKTMNYIQCDLQISDGKLIFFLKSLIFYFRVCDATFFEHIFPLENKLSKSI